MTNKGLRGARKWGPCLHLRGTEDGKLETLAKIWTELREAVEGQERESAGGGEHGSGSGGEFIKAMMEEGRVHQDVFTEMV